MGYEKKEHFNLKYKFEIFLHFQAETTLELFQ